MAKVPNAVEKLQTITTAWVGCWVHKRYRRQTDGWATAYRYSERERSLKTHVIKHNGQNEIHCAMMKAYW